MYWARSCIELGHVLLTKSAKLLKPDCGVTDGVFPWEHWMPPTPRHLIQHMFASQNRLHDDHTPIITQNHPLLSRVFTHRAWHVTAGETTVLSPALFEAHCVSRWNASRRHTEELLKCPGFCGGGWLTRKQPYKIIYILFQNDRNNITKIVNFKQD